MSLTPEDYVGTVLLCLLLSIVCYCMAPRHWQQGLGLLLMCIGWIPGGLVLLAAMKEPVILIPAAFLGGIVAISSRRAA